MTIHTIIDYTMRKKKWGTYVIEEVGSSTEKC